MATRLKNVIVEHDHENESWNKNTIVVNESWKGNTEQVVSILMYKVGR